jgi:dTDP-4-dehydrorhamnose reductase
VKILLVGATGQVGWRLARVLPRIGETVIAGRESLDLSQPDAIRLTLRAVRPDVVVNAAGYTEVDRAESEPELAHAVNATAPGVLAEETKRLGALIVHYSSVFVFDGTKAAPYTEADEPRPINVYGESKRRGDEAVMAAAGAHLIFRASWVYDVRGRNYLLTILRLARERTALAVVDDQMGSPTSAAAIARATAAILQSPDRARGASGIYNLAAPNGVSRYDFTRRILAAATSLRECGVTPVLERTKTSRYPLPAARPLNAVLDCSKAKTTFGASLPEWTEQLDDCVRDLEGQRAP